MEICLGLIRHSCYKLQLASEDNWASPHYPLKDYSFFFLYVFGVLEGVYSKASSFVIGVK
jgi:hypothetical protein